MPTKSKSSTTTRRPRAVIERAALDAGRVELGDVLARGHILPSAPGELLREDFLQPMGLSAERLAEGIGLSRARVQALLGGRRAIDAELALRLGRFLGVRPEYWLQVQADHDLGLARRALGRLVQRDVRPYRAAAE